LLGIVQRKVPETHFTVVSSVIYRQMELFETAAVAALACEVFDQFVAPHYQSDGVSEFYQYASANALSKRHESDHVTLVAEHSGEFVGMLHLRKPCHVAMLFVRSSFQRRGIGRGLLAAAGVFLGDANCEFTLNSSPNAVAAYEQLGFRAIGDEQCVRGIRFIPMRRDRRSNRRDIGHDP
jgi:ribosomal protein S18 acetylase RimI-like enzyme